MSVKDHAPMETFHQIHLALMPSQQCHLGQPACDQDLGHEEAQLPVSDHRNIAAAWLRKSL